jgi:hypothetical protein
MIIGHDTKSAFPVGAVLTVTETGFTAQLLRLHNDDTDQALPAIAGAQLHPALTGKLVCLSAPLQVEVADLKARAEFADHGLWCWPISMDMASSFGLPFNRFAETTVTKRGAEEAHRRKETSLIKLCVPYRDAPLSEWGLHVNTHPDWPLVVAGGMAVFGADFYDFTATIYPRVVAPGSLDLAAEGDVAIPLRLTNPAGEILAQADADLYLESTGGYLPRTRIRVTDGLGVARLRALGLEAGDSVKVKIGFRFFSGAAETIVRVI